jgi:hypothetical protein
MRVGAASIALLLALLGATPVATRKPSWEIAVVSDTGLMGPGWWRVDVYRDGRVQIAREEDKTRWMKITPEALGRMWQAVARQRVLDLEAAYGRLCEDCPACRLMIHDDRGLHSIALLPLETIAVGMRDDAARILNVIDAIKVEVDASAWPDACR